MSQSTEKRRGKLRGRVAVVVGAGSGIGAATARCLAAHEVSGLVVADLKEANARRVAEELRQSGTEAMAVRVDVRDEEQVHALMEQAAAAFGRIDILHNNAAALDDATLGRDGVVHELETEVWDNTMAVNVRGTMLGCKHVLPYMIRAAGGAIVNTSSILGSVSHSSRAAYGASKAAVEALTRSVSHQYGPYGIRCNAIAPGIVITEHNLRTSSETAREAFVAAASLKWRGDPWDQGEVVAFLASDEARFVTGQVITVDGGLTGKMPTG